MHKYSSVPSVTCALQAGYYCNVCDCILRDSQSYLDHINGKYHNRALGMSMVVEKSTADDVRKRFEELKKTKDDPVPVDSVLDGKCCQVTSSTPFDDFYA